jgi:hypothetical protein
MMMNDVVGVAAVAVVAAAIGHDHGACEGASQPNSALHCNKQITAQYEYAYRMRI